MDSYLPNKRPNQVERLSLFAIYKKAEIPQSRIYDIAVALKNKGLINSFVKDNKEYYRSLDPKHSINAYITQLKWNHEKTLELEKIKFENKIKLLAEEFLKGIALKQKDSKKLIDLLKKIDSKSIPCDDDLFQLIKGKFNLVNHITEQVKLSNRIIKSVSLPSYLPEALIWENISNKLKKGLKYFHLAYSGLLLEWGLWRIEQDKKTGVFFRFLPKNEIKDKFYIFDDKSCFVRLRDPITNNFSEHGILFKEKKLVIRS